MTVVPRKLNMKLPILWFVDACFIGAITVGCSSAQRAPATADAVEPHTPAEPTNSADSTQQDLRAGREKLALANQALAAKDYKASRDYARQAQVDARQAYAKADTARGRAISAMLQVDIQALRTTLERVTASDSVSRLHKSQTPTAGSQ